MKHHQRHPKKASVELGDESPMDDRMQRIVERPDGYHWVDAAGRQEFGSYDTLETALADMDQPDDEAIEQAELVDEAEQALDIDSRVDPLDEDAPEGAT